MYSEDACARPSVASAGTHPFATECAAKNPAVNTSSPATTTGSHGTAVSSSPPSITRAEPSSTGFRPNRPARPPARAEDHVPER